MYTGVRKILCLHKNLRQLHFWEEVFFLYYTSKYCTKIWGNSIFGRKFFSYTTQVKVFTKFWGNSIFGRKLGSFFSYTTQVKVCTKFWSNSIFGRKYFFLYYTSKSLPKILNQLHFCRSLFFLMLYKQKWWILAHFGHKNYFH